MRFQCQDSCGGACCKAGKFGSFVFLTKEDVQRIQLYTGMAEEQFASAAKFKMTRFSPEGPVRSRFIKSYGEPCMFLRDGKCGIYPARPTQCRTFPFWPENQDYRRQRDLAKQCPGIGEGPEDNETATELLNDQRRADRIYQE